MSDDEDMNQDADGDPAKAEAPAPHVRPQRTATERFGARHPPGAPPASPPPLRVAGLRRHSEMPWLAGGLAVLLSGWWALNSFYFNVYPDDITEKGRFTVIHWGTDPNPARNEQINIFNRAYRDDNLKAVVDPGGGVQGIITRSASHNAPDVCDGYQPEVLRQFAAKGIAVQLNKYMKEEPRLDLNQTWPALIPNISLPNPDWKEGDDPIDKRLWYAVPNNLSYDLCFFNHTLYQTASKELQKDGREVPPEPWLAWTWWDYAALAAVMERRSPDGRFLSYGATPPSVQNVALEIGASMRGESQDDFAKLTPEQRAARGIPPGVDWDDCITINRAGADGKPVVWPNRPALEQALGFSYDLTSVFGAVPSQSDQQQMATGGSGYGGSGLTGQFLSGNCGMLFIGRWYLGQIRANTAFDWRMYRMPRWVPYSEWARWRRAGMGPGQRDGEWGDRPDVGHGDRGYLAYVATRCTFMTSSAKNPRQAASFLKFIAANPDFNRLLLLEDGAGADFALARDYLSKVDPLIPDELKRRPPEQELGAIRNQTPIATWPWGNYDARYNLDNHSLGTWTMSEVDQAPSLAPGTADDDHPELLPFVRGPANPTLRSQPAVAHDLAERYCTEITKLAETAIANDHPAQATAPTGRTWIMLGLLAVIGAGVGVGRLRRSSRG